MKRDIDTNIRDYFNYVRMRCDKLQQLFDRYGAEFRVERYIVLGAILESLSARRAQMLGRKRLPGAEKMAEFLCSYGPPDVFGRCSGPDLLRRARDEHPNVLDALKAKIKFHPLTGIVREWHDDPLLEELLADQTLKAAAAGISDLPTWLRASCYGDMIYRNFRCAWVHSLGPNRDLLSTDGEAPEYADEAPDYDNRAEAIEIADDRPPVEAFEYEIEDIGVLDEDNPTTKYLFLTRKTFRVRFMYLLGVLREAVDTFEGDCLKRGFDPIPPEWNRR
jgi:hypothetical protein